MAAIKDALAGLVKAGTLTQAQADKVATTLDQKLPERGFRGHGMRIGAGLDEVAGIIGITQDQLRTQLRNGKTLAEIAKSKGISQDTLVAKLVAAAKARLAAEVKAGRLTQARADAITAHLTTRITRLVTSTPPMRGPGHQVTSAVAGAGARTVARVARHRGRRRRPRARPAAAPDRPMTARPCSAPHRAGPRLRGGSRRTSRSVPPRARAGRSPRSGRACRSPAAARWPAAARTAAISGARDPQLPGGVPVEADDPLERAGVVDDQDLHATCRPAAAAGRGRRALAGRQHGGPAQAAQLGGRVGGRPVPEQGVRVQHQSEVVHPPHRHPRQARALGSRPPSPRRRAKAEPVDAERRAANAEPPASALGS